MGKKFDPFTSLTALKMAMNGGEVPPMTPLTERAKKLIDPEFTIGMGAFREDETKGLQCAVRGCGGFYHNLGKHLDMAHKAAGGRQAVLAALELPKTTRLSSQASVARRRQSNSRQLVRATARAHEMRSSGVLGPHPRRKHGQRNSVKAELMGVRNHRNVCEAQVRKFVVDLSVQLGRSPSIREGRKLIGDNWVKRVLRVYGTWHNAVTMAGLKPHRPSRKEFNDHQRELALAALRAWYKAHGDLPSSEDAWRGDQLPLLPHRDSIMRGLKTDSWYEAMRRAAALLNIRGGRYGLPEKQERSA